MEPKLAYLEEVVMATVLALILNIIAIVYFRRRQHRGKHKGQRREIEPFHSALEPLELEFCHDNKESIMEQLVKRLGKPWLLAGEYNVKVVLETPRAFACPLPAPAEPKEPSECVVCFSAEPTHAFLPCGHFICCGVCVKGLRMCPLCNAGDASRVLVKRGLQ